MKKINNGFEQLEINTFSHWMRLLLLASILFISFTSVPLFKCENSAAYAAEPLQPPSNIVLTDLGLNSVNITWSKGATANNTLIMGSRLEQPTSNSTGEVVYSGNLTSCVLTGVSLTIDNIKLSFWSELGGEYSPTYTTANIGGEGMEDIAIAIEKLNTTLDAGVEIDISILSEFILMITISLIMFLALWKNRSILFRIIAAPVGLVYGLTLAASNTQDSTMWIAGVVIAIIGTSFLFTPAIETIKWLRNKGGE